MVAPTSRIRRHGDDDHDRIKVKKLNKCIRDVFKGTSSTSLGSCLGNNNDVKVDRKSIRIETQKFSRFAGCMCSPRPETSCRFKFPLFEQNQTVLKGCFNRTEDINTPFPHKIQGSYFMCEIGHRLRIRCEPKKEKRTEKKTRFQEILHCLSRTLKDIPCSISTTPAQITTTTFAPPMTKLTIFVMALVISLMLGVLGTGLGIFCWRKKKRNRVIEEPSRDNNKNMYTAPEAIYHRRGDMPDMVVELPHLGRPNVLNHEYHILEPVRRNAALDSMPQISGAIDDGYEPVCNTYDRLEDYDLEARPVPKPRFQGCAENTKSSGQSYPYR